MLKSKVYQNSLWSKIRKRKNQEKTMSSSKNRIPIEGSEREPLFPGAHIVGAIDPHEHIRVTVVVRRSPSNKELSSVIKELSAQKLSERKYLSRDELATAYGADPADLAKIEEFAHEYGLNVVEVKAAQRRVILEGTAAALSVAFGTYLARYEHPKGSYRGRTGPVHVPEDIAPIVENVLGLDNRPQARFHSRILGEKGGNIKPQAEGLSGYIPLQIAELYDFQKGLDGTGQCIAIIELNTSNIGDPIRYNGTGYDTADFDTYFAQLGIPKPNIKAVSVMGGHNIPGVNLNADGEVALDIEVAGAIAPGAQIVVYFAHNTNQGFSNAISAAVHDKLNNPSVISISWGGAEKYWTRRALKDMDDVLQEAASLGVTVCCSAGDHGSTDGEQDGHLHVDFPGSNSYMLCCGGTRLEGQGSTITNEVVWNDNDGWATGGGISDFVPLPTWQTGANVPPSANPSGHIGRIGRGVPDVAGDADQSTGYQIQVGGQQMVIGGTSAVAPLWAGLIALFNQKLGKPVGFLNPVLYSLPVNANAFNDITVGNNDASGNNGPYSANVGWDACTGLGSPDGMKLLSALTKR